MDLIPNITRMKLTTISVFLLACLSLSAAVNTQYLQGLTSPVQANIDSRVLKAGDTMTGPLVIGGGTVTASTPVLDLTQTWTEAAVSFVGANINVVNTASALTSYPFRVQVNGSDILYARRDGFLRVFGTMEATGNIVVGSALYLGNTSDVALQRSAAGVLDLRNGANAQTWNVYGTADAGLLNYRRIRTTMTTGGAATIAAEGLGTGVSGNTLVFVVNGTTGLSISSAGNVTSGGSLVIPSSSSILWSGRSIITSPADAQLLFGNSTATDADFFLKLGVNTSAAAGIKRVGTALQVRLNDDSARGNMEAGALGLNSTLTMGEAANMAFGTTTGTKIGGSTSQKIGFWNATPIVQPSSTGETVGFTAGGGTAVTDASTFTGNVGSTAYRLSDIVKHLKNAGFLAQ